MTLLVLDAETDKLAETLAEVRRTSKGSAVRVALQNELDRETQSAEIRTSGDALSMRSRVEEIQRRLLAMQGPNPQPVTKEWRDWLSE